MWKIGGKMKEQIMCNLCNHPATHYTKDMFKDDFYACPICKEAIDRVSKTEREWIKCDL